MTVLSTIKTDTHNIKYRHSKFLSAITTGVTIAAIGALSMTAPTLANAKTVQPSTASYTFTVEDKYNGSATRTLSKSGNVWRYNVNARVAGVASAAQNSAFTIVGNNVTPTQASTTYKLLGIGRTHKLDFNPSTNKVVSTYKGKSTTMDMAQQAFDDLSLEVQIRQDLLNGKFSGNYYMAKKNKIESTPFKKSGNTQITVPAGTFDTVRVDRIHDGDSRATSFWLAPSLDYLPVKVSQINDGKKMDLELTKVN